jgi:tetratricopeptide (TPR) repeat protein
MTSTVELDTDALIDRGVRRLRAGDWAGAVADLSAALRRDPDRADAYHHRAGAYLAGWELRAARADADTAVCRVPERSNFWLTRANVRYHLGEVAAAWEDYRASFALDPDGNAREVVDTIADQVARSPQLALRDCDQHLRADPGDFLSRVRRGLILILCGRGAEAEGEFVVHDRQNPDGTAQSRRYAEEALRRRVNPSPGVM